MFQSIPNPCVRAASQFQASASTISPLVASLVGHLDSPYANIQSAQSGSVSEVSARNSRSTRERANELRENSLTISVDKWNVQMRREPQVGYLCLQFGNTNSHLHNSSFRDALCLRYGWKATGLPTSCVCGKSFTVDHSLSCGYTIMRHNELKANLL